MPLNPALRRQRQEDLCEFEDSLVYRVSSRVGSKAIRRNAVSENQKKERKKCYVCARRDQRELDALELDYRQL